MFIVSELDVRALMNELIAIAHKWFNIGIQLRIDYHILKGFEQQYKDNPSRCLLEMLHYWLNGNGKSCVKWETIIEALRSPLVSESGIADKLVESNQLQPAASECCSQSTPIQGTCSCFVEYNVPAKA